MRPYGSDNEMKFDLTLQELYDSKYTFYSVVAGSKAYGLDNEHSDEDIRGYYYVPEEYRHSLIKCGNQTQDDKHDITYYAMHRAFELLMTANPNQIELLWIPDDCIRVHNNTIMSELMENRDLFISQASYQSHFRYAKSQISKAKGCNKRVNNPQPVKWPTKEDFCWFVDVKFFGSFVSDYESGYETAYPTDMPCRPVPVKDLTYLDLSKYDAAKMERMENTFRLYKNGRGVFRGDQEQLVVTSIPMSREWEDLEGLIIFNEHSYKRARKEWKEYWSWKEKRNESRWVDQEKGDLDYDAKNMSHCLRLMLSSKHILTEGYPLVRFEGEQRDHLMAVKNGDLEYEEIMEEVETLQKEIEVVLPKTKVPEHIEFDKINKLYVHLSQVAEKEIVG